MRRIEQRHGRDFIKHMGEWVRRYSPFRLRAGVGPKRPRGALKVALEIELLIPYESGAVEHLPYLSAQAAGEGGAGGGLTVNDFLGEPMRAFARFEYPA